MHVKKENYALIKDMFPLREIDYTHNGTSINGFLPLVGKRHITRAKPLFITKALI